MWWILGAGWRHLSGWFGRRPGPPSPRERFEETAEVESGVPPARGRLEDEGGEAARRSHTPRTPPEL